MKNYNVFTPKKISILMNSFLSKTGNLLEPSVGIGNLLLDIEKYENIDIFDINKEFLDKIQNINNMNKYNTDFIKYQFNKKYDNIIMNPPYTRYQDIDLTTRNYIKSNFKLLKSGNIDLYMVFVNKCMNLLNENGTFVCVIPNSFLHNKSSNNLLKKLIEKNIIYKIIDFHSEKIFPKINVYCCILVIKNIKQEYFTYNDEKIYYNKITDNIFIENGNETLDKYINTFSGIATLADSIFIHKQKLFNETIWKEIFKVSTNTIHFIIYPYTENGKIIDETILKKDNPLTYQYLLINKDKLNNRDKGKGKYKAWYAFGREQGIKIKKTEFLLIPSLSNINYPIYIKKDILFYSGIGIDSEKINIYDLKEKINNEKSRKFLFKISSKRSKDWFNISTSNIRKIRF